MKKYLLAIFSITAFYSNSTEPSLREIVSTLLTSPEASRLSYGLVSLPDDPRNLVIQQFVTNYVNNHAYNLSDAAFIQQLIDAQVISNTDEIHRYIALREVQRELERLTTSPEEELIDALNESLAYESDYSDRARLKLGIFKDRFPDVDILSLPYKGSSTLRDYLINLEDFRWDRPNKYVERFRELYR